MTRAPDSNAPSDWIVTYEGHDLHLTRDEYVELREAAQDDPGRADMLARLHLAAVERALGNQPLQIEGTP